MLKGRNNPEQAGTLAHILKEALAAGLLHISRVVVGYFSCRSDCSLPESSQVDAKKITKLPQLCGDAAAAARLASVQRALLDQLQHFSTLRQRFWVSERMSHT